MSKHQSLKPSQEVLTVKLHSEQMKVLQSINSRVEIIMIISSVLFGMILVSLYLGLIFK